MVDNIKIVLQVNIKHTLVVNLLCYELTINILVVNLKIVLRVYVKHTSDVNLNIVLKVNNKHALVDNLTIVLEILYVPNLQDFFR